MESLHEQLRGQVEFDLTRPHPKFGYPKFPELPAIDQSSDSLKQMIYPGRPQEVFLFKDYLQALEARIFCLPTEPRSLGCLEVPSKEIFALSRKHGLELVQMPRDPDQWNIENLASVDLWVLTNPNREDGFFYPQEFYQNLINAIFAKNPNAKVVSDESLSIFTFGEVAPGSLKKHPKVDILDSIYPARSPQGPEISWLILRHEDEHKRAHEFVRLNTTVEESSPALKTATEAYMAFLAKQGPAIQEFQRKMLVMRQGLRDLTDELKPIFSNSKLPIHFWPETGFNLCLDVREILEVRGWSVEKLCLEMARSAGVLANPGSLFGQKNLIQICFALPLPTLRKASKAFGEFLAATKLP